MVHDYLHYLTDEQFIEKVCQIVPQQFHARLEEFTTRLEAHETQRLQDCEVFAYGLEDSLETANREIFKLKLKLSEAESRV